MKGKTRLSTSKATAKRKVSVVSSNSENPDSSFADFLNPIETINQRNSETPEICMPNSLVNSLQKTPSDINPKLENIEEDEVDNAPEVDSTDSPKWECFDYSETSSSTNLLDPKLEFSPPEQSPCTSQEASQSEESLKINNDEDSNTVKSKNLHGKNNRALATYQRMAEQHMKRFLKEAGLTPAALELNCFQELVRHLNPMITIPSLSNEEVTTTKKKLIIKYNTTDPNSGLQFDPPCIVCQEPIPTSKSLTLSVNDAVKVLLASVTCGKITLKEAQKIICGHPLRMCKSDLNPAYEMMCQTVGVKHECEVANAPKEKLMAAFDIYRSLKAIRETLLQKPLAKTNFGSFKMMIRAFFKTYAPRFLSVNEEKTSEAKVAEILKKVDPNASLRDFMFSGNINLSKDEQESLMQAFRNPKRAKLLADFEAQKDQLAAEKNNRIKMLLDKFAPSGVSHPEEESSSSVDNSRKRVLICRPKTAVSEPGTSNGSGLSPTLDSVRQQMRPLIHLQMKWPPNRHTPEPIPIGHKIQKPVQMQQPQKRYVVAQPGRKYFVRGAPQQVPSTQKPRFHNILSNGHVQTRVQLRVPEGQQPSLQYQNQMFSQLGPSTSDSIEQCHQVSQAGVNEEKPNVSGSLNGVITTSEIPVRTSSRIFVRNAMKAVPKEEKPDSTSITGLRAPRVPKEEIEEDYEEEFPPACMLMSNGD